MAQAQRQTKLFAAEDYTAVYESYINANLQAYDFDTIRDSMVSYIRENYPESYNDWVESAEFVSLLDVVARFGHALAFRIDINARNNFISTAERTDSVYKLANFLGYTPRRNTTASGFVKVVSVKTNEDIIGNNGTTLSGQEFNFENSTSADNLDNFINIMNAVFASTNPFGSPRKQVTVDNVVNQFYNFNNTENQVAFNFTGIAQGTQTTFNAYSSDYNTDTLRYEEKSPDPQSAFSILYKNDGQGVLSNNTGFFFGLKEGNLDFQDFNVQDAVSGITLDVDAENINQTDVWVQTINQDGTVIKNWTKVNEVFGTNVIFNNLSNGIRDIFSVKSLVDNRISIQFADSSFGNLPNGIIRVWFRSSLDETYTLRPDDIGLKRINMTYKGADNNTYTATFVVQLKSTVNSASSAESIDDIRVSAPQSYASQNRMITASDYNGFLGSTSDNMKKIKAVNRTHSGFSRYVDLKDPTGAYSNLRLFGTDGKLYSCNKRKTTIASDISAAQVFDSYIKRFVSDDELINLYYNKFATTFVDLKSTYSLNLFSWAQSTQYPLTGYFLNGTTIHGVGENQSSYLQLIRTGAMLKFTYGGTEYWAQVKRIYNNGLGVDNTSGDPTGITPDDQGAISLDVAIPSNATLETIYPAISRQFTKTERNTVIDYIKAKQTFALKYDYINNAWEIVERSPLPTGSNTIFPAEFSTNLNVTAGQYITGLEYRIQSLGNTDFTLIGAGANTVGTNFIATGPGTGTGVASSTKDNNWLIHISYESSNNVDKWSIVQRVLRYELTTDQMEFSNITNEFFMDGESRKKKRDKVLVTDTSTAGFPSTTFYIWGYDFKTDGDKSGVYDPTKVILASVDADDNDRPDNPEAFSDVVGTNEIDIDIDNDGDLDTVFGKENLRYEWTHVPDHNELIDPSFTNLIDVFTLSTTYDTKFRAYLKDTTGQAGMPVADTVTSLRSAFDDQTERKAMSDSIVYRPANYKVIFGPKSDTEFRAKFRIIKMAGVKFTDNEIKNQVVNVIEEYFNPANWEFGESFYFTELAAYVHKELAGVISSFVIVPLGTNAVFGDLFQITPFKDQLLIPDISITDIDIISGLTQANINLAQGSY